MSPALADMLAQLGIVAASAAAAFAVAWLAPKLKRGAAPDRSGARATVLLGAAAAAFAITFIYLALKKFDAFRAPAVDLGIQHHVFWAGGRGGFLYQTVLFSRPHLNHVALANQLLSPLSLLFSSPRALIVIQGLALAAAAVPAYLVARRHTASRYLALAFGLSPLFFASTQWVALYDFHPRIFAPALLLWALWAMEAGRTRVGLLFFFLTTLLLEELALYTCAAGLFLILGLKQTRFGLLVCVYSFVYFLAATYVVYPQLMDVTDLASNPILHTFGVAGSPLDLVRHAAHDPAFFLTRAVDPARAAYLLHALTPWAFLPAAAGWGWLAYATPVTYALFSRVPSHYGIQYQYVMPLLPFLVYFAVRAWGAIEKRLKRRGRSAGWARRFATAYLILAGTASALAFGPLGLRYNPSWYNAEPWMSRFPRVARFVSADDSLAASMFLLPHLSERWRVYLFPHKFRYAPKLLPREVVVCTSNLDESWDVPSASSENLGRTTLVKLMRNDKYGCVYADGDYVILRRGATPIIPAAQAFAWTFKTLEEDVFDYEVGVPILDERARNGRALYCAAEQGRLGTMTRAGPYYWPEGPVQVEYRMALRDAASPFAPAAELVVVERRPDGPPAAVAVRRITPADLPAAGGYGWATTAFPCRKDCRYEFRLYPLGNGDIYLDYIHVDAPKLSLEWAFRDAEAKEEREILAAKGAELMCFYEAPPPTFELK